MVVEPRDGLAVDLVSHWRDFCHFADALSPPLLKDLTKVEGGCSRMTVSPTAVDLVQRGDRDNVEAVQREQPPDRPELRARGTPSQHVSQDVLCGPV